MKIVVVTYFLFIVFLSYFFQSELSIIHASAFGVTSHPNHVRNDRFGIREIYPTKENGREWYVNMENPKNDQHFSITFNPNLTRQGDGSWRISVPVVRMNVRTLEGESNWRNVEMR